MGIGKLAQVYAVKPEHNIPMNGKEKSHQTHMSAGSGTLVTIYCAPNAL